MNKANECTCPSGDGSLVHPCPAHPAVEQACWDERKLSDLGNELHNLSCSIVHENEKLAEQIGGIARELWNWPQACAALAQPSPAHPAPVEQAGGDERDFQAKGAQEVPSPVSKEYDRHLIGLLRKGEALPGHQEEAADEIERLRDWNDHLNNTVLPNILNPNFLMLMKGGERLLDLCTKDGKFIGVSLNDMKDVFDWMVTHARIAPDHAALAQPSPAQAEAEQPEIVAFRYRCTNAEGEPLPGWFYSDGAGTLGLREPLMAVSQHERIIGAMRAVVTQLRQHKSDYMDAGQETYWALQNEIREREAEIARLDGLVSSRTVERDAAQAEVERLRQGMKGDYDIDAWLEWTKERDTALARVAELERQQPVAWMHDQPNRVDVIHRDVKDLLQRVPGSSRGIYRPLDVSEHYTIPLYAAPVAQAQHSVPEVSGIGRDFAYPRSVVLYLRTEPTDDDLRAIHDGLLSLAAAPGKEGNDD
ncbi:hypothetical protein P6M03_006255 [Pseudomonas aeruginosa]|nr:hypothetical protein [Pseudomonas aeruginosa]